MQDNSGGDELDPAEGVRRCCKRNSPVLFCIDKRTKRKAIKLQPINRSCN